MLSFQQFIFSKRDLSRIKFRRLQTFPPCLSHYNPKITLAVLFHQAAACNGEKQYQHSFGKSVCSYVPGQVSAVFSHRLDTVYGESDVDVKRFECFCHIVSDFLHQVHVSLSDRQWQYQTPHIPQCSLPDRSVQPQGKTGPRSRVSGQNLHCQTFGKYSKAIVNLCQFC